MGKATIDPEDERVLLLLGLLMSERQHGYQIYEFIERSLAQISNMRKATAYALLDRLAGADLVNATMEQAGNRPVRRTFSITDDGKALFARMLAGILASPVFAEPQGDIALMFVDYLDRDVAQAALQSRIDRLNTEIAGLERAPVHGTGVGVDLAINRRLELVRADRAWFLSVLARLPEMLPEEAAFTGSEDVGHEPGLENASTPSSHDTMTPP